MGSLPDLDTEISDLEDRLKELKKTRANIESFNGKDNLVKCHICGDKGYTEYYYDAGDHFGAGRAPGSGWKEKPCECRAAK